MYYLLWNSCLLQTCFNAAGDVAEGDTPTGTQFTCFTSTKVQILTTEVRDRRPFLYRILSRSRTGPSISAGVCPTMPPPRHVGKSPAFLCKKINFETPGLLCHHLDLWGNLKISPYYVRLHPRNKNTVMGWIRANGTHIIIKYGGLAKRRCKSSRWLIWWTAGI